LLFPRELVDGAAVVEEVGCGGRGGGGVANAVVALPGAGVEAAENAFFAGTAEVVVDVAAVVVAVTAVVVLVVSGHGVCSPVRTGVPLKLSKAFEATVNPAGEEHSMATVDSAVPAL